jgi:hypothetical protein
MTLRHHLVTMTNGESMAKMNQRTNFVLIAFCVWILSFYSTSCNAFIFGVQASQRSPKTPSKTIQLANIGPAITTSSFLQLLNDSPAKQHPVPHDGPAYFKQLSVPMTTTSTGLTADNDCHSILNDVKETSIWHQAFDNFLFHCPIINTSNITFVPALNAPLTSSYLHPAGGMMAHIDATPTSLLLLHVKDVPATTATIHDPSLLLPLC